MKNISEILAKSKEFGRTTLLEHTQDVLNVALFFSKKLNYNFDEKAVMYGSILHDIGKSHSYFQTIINNDDNDDFDFSEYKHRHEISSLAFLPAIPKEYWDGVIDMVVAHHKSIEGDSRGRGILDIKSDDRNAIANHLDNFGENRWDEMRYYGIEILRHFKIFTDGIDYNDAYAAIDYAIQYCKKKQKNVSYYRGLLKAADHFASAFGTKSNEISQKTFLKPNLEKYFASERISELYPLSVIPINDSRKHTIVVAPTGAGKTDFLMKRTSGRIFYTLPFQASINSMWERCRSMDKDNPDIRLLHSTSKVIIDKNTDEKILQPLVGSSIKILTPHQLAAIIFGTPGFESVMLDLKGCDIILDEIHTYSDISKSMVLEIVKTLIRLDCKIHIGTATMPSMLYEHIKQLLGGDECVYEVKLNDSTLETFNRHRIEKIFDESLISDIIENSISNNEKLLIVFNTIDKSQEFFKNLDDKYPNIPKMLIHSRFRRKDRASLEKLLQTEFDGGSENSGLKPCIVVSTQVVEVSLDISFDRMITQAAPIDSLIQRFGRVNRRRNSSALSSQTRIYKPIHILCDEKSHTPYDKELVSRSIEALPDNFELLEEKNLQSMIDKVYNKFELKPIDVHLIYRDNKYVIKELTDNRKSILSDLLEIDSLVCVLESDKENYINSNFEDKIKYEIPISLNKIKYSKQKFEQLRVGAYPLVIPQSEDEHTKYGLKINKNSNLI